MIPWPWRPRSPRPRRPTNPWWRTSSSRSRHSITKQPLTKTITQTMTKKVVKAKETLNSRPMSGKPRTPRPKKQMNPWLWQIRPRYTTPSRHMKSRPKGHCTHDHRVRRGHSQAGQVALIKWSRDVWSRRSWKLEQGGYRAMNQEGQMARNQGVQG